MDDVPFWRRKTLSELTPTEWESLCDGCGALLSQQALRTRIRDGVYYTDVGCRLLDGTNLPMARTTGNRSEQVDDWREAIARQCCRSQVAAARPAVTGWWPTAAIFIGGIRWCPAIPRPCTPAGIFGTRVASRFSGRKNIGIEGLRGPHRLLGRAGCRRGANARREDSVRGPVGPPKSRCHCPA